MRSSWDKAVLDQLAQLRSGHFETIDALIDLGQKYVQKHRRSLTGWDIEISVAEALEDLVTDPDFLSKTTEDQVHNYKRLLNRARARYDRRSTSASERYQSLTDYSEPTQEETQWQEAAYPEELLGVAALFEKSPSLLVNSYGLTGLDLDEEESRLHLQDVAAELSRHFSLAFETLSPRDRALLVEQYRLDEVGIEAPSHELKDLSKEAQRTALSRARTRFYRAFKDVLSNADTIMGSRS